jgi:hypothetical protein
MSRERKVLVTVVPEAAKAERWRDDTLGTKTPRCAGPTPLLFGIVVAGKPVRMVRWFLKGEAAMFPWGRQCDR